MTHRIGVGLVVKDERRSVRSDPEGVVGAVIGQLGLLACVAGVARIAGTAIDRIDGEFQDGDSGLGEQVDRKSVAAGHPEGVTPGVVGERHDARRQSDDPDVDVVVRVVGAARGRGVDAVLVVVNFAVEFVEVFDRVTRLEWINWPELKQHVHAVQGLARHAGRRVCFGAEDD